MGERKGVGEGAEEGEREEGGGMATPGVGAGEKIPGAFGPSVCSWGKGESSESDGDCVLPFFQSDLANVCSHAQSFS